MAGQTVRIVLLRVVSSRTRTSRQLHYGRVLTFAQLRQQNDLPVGKLKGVMMNV
jgi:hypothetical protein